MTSSYLSLVMMIMLPATPRKRGSLLEGQVAVLLLTGLSDWDNTSSMQVDDEDDYGEEDDDGDESEEEGGRSK